MIIYTLEVLVLVLVMVIVIDNCSIYYTKTFNGKSCFKEAKINSLLVYYI